MNGGMRCVCDDVREGCLPQSRRTREKNMFENILPLTRGLDHEHEALGHLLLTMEVLKPRWSESKVERRIRFLNGVFRHVSVLGSLQVPVKAPGEIDCCGEGVIPTK